MSSAPRTTYYVVTPNENHAASAIGGWIEGEYSDLGSAWLDAQALPGAWVALCTQETGESPVYTRAL